MRAIDMHLLIKGHLLTYLLYLLTYLLTYKNLN